MSFFLSFVTNAEAGSARRTFRRVMEVEIQVGNGKRGKCNSDILYKMNDSLKLRRTPYTKATCRSEATTSGEYEYIVRAV